MSDPNNYWWCAHCKAEVPGFDVTFSEHHHVCGHPVRIVEMTDPITALRAEVERLRQHRDGHMPDCAGMDEPARMCGCGYLQGEAYRDLVAQLSARDAEVRALREDVARYRWLRKGGFNLPDLPYRRQSFAKSVAEIEAAIDRCRSDGEDDNG